MALSLCQALTQRTALATRERAYHGIIGLSRSMTVQPQWHGGLAVHAGGSQASGADGAGADSPGARWRDLRRAAEQHAAERISGRRRATLADTAATIIDYTQGGIYYDGAYQDELALRAREAGSILDRGRGRHRRGPRGTMVRVPRRREPSRYRDARQIARRRRCGGRGGRGVERHRRAAQGQELAELRNVAWSSDQHGRRQRLPPRDHEAKTSSPGYGSSKDCSPSVCSRSPGGIRASTRGGSGPALDHRAAWTGLADLARRYP